MKSYIVAYKTPDGDLKERHIEARNHIAAAKAVQAEGFEVTSVDRDDDGDQMARRSRKDLKMFIISLVFGALVAGAFVAYVWWRYGRH